MYYFTHGEKVHSTIFPYQSEGGVLIALSLALNP